MTTGAGGATVPPEAVTAALRRLRREIYQLDTTPDGTRIRLVMDVSAAGRRNGAHHILLQLERSGLTLDAADPVSALADDGAALLVRPAPEPGRKPAD